MLISALQKIGAKYKLIFTTLFLACFACASISLAVHSFSHKFSFLQKADSEAVFLVSENSAAKNHQSPSHDLSHCALCFLSSIENNSIFAASIIFVAEAFFLFLIWRKFNRVKLSYLLASFSSRAPPFVS